MARLRGFATLLYAAVTMALVFLTSLPVMLLTGRGDLPMWVARVFWGPSCLRVAGARLVVHRRAPVPDGPVIFAANHESALDIFAVVAAAPRTVRFLAKRELFRIPVFGWYLALGGHVEVDRRDHQRAVASLSAAADRVRRGLSLMVFPEGTRSLDRQVHPFKKGPFVIACQAGVPVVPVAVSGSGAATPKRRIEVHPGAIHVSIGAAVHPAEVEGRDDLLVEVRRRIIEMHRATGGLGGDVGDAVAAPGFEGSSAPLVAPAARR
jgi:1-acyl-sn-glycerol-3-phosphate acyltransferase